jgi:hypothetical protein
VHGEVEPGEVAPVVQRLAAALVLLVLGRDPERVAHGVLRAHRLTGAGAGQDAVARAALAA